MNKFDKLIKKSVKKEKIKISDNAKQKIELALANLPEKEENDTRSKNIKLLPKLTAVAASFVFVCLVLLPNISVVYAQALEKIPLISNIVNVVTIRNYFYSDDNHEMNINVPKIENESNKATEYINKDVQELTQILADRFNQELEEIGDEGHSSIYVDYDVITNSDTWFTLKMTIFEAAGSSNIYYKYYHIDKKVGDIVYLGDLSNDTNKFYEIIENDIKSQMKEQMSQNPDLIYCLENSPFGQDFVTLDDKHNFYWDKNGDIVIVFDKYEVAPGFMGTPEFTVNKDLIKNLLKNEYK